MAFISFLTRRAAARALLVVACGAGLAAHAGPLRAALDDDDGMDAAVAAAPLPASVRVPLWRHVGASGANLRTMS